MKMTDSLGRVLCIDLVHQTESLSVPGDKLWTRPPEFNLIHAGTTYAALPHGQFAVRVMSTAPTELLVFQEGRLLISAQVQKGINYLERDAQGKPLAFLEPGQDGPTVVGEISGFGTEGISLLELASHSAVAEGEAEDADAADTDESVQLANTAPADPGIVFVVARFANDPSIVGHQPPASTLR